MAATLQNIVRVLADLPKEDEEGEEIDHMIFAAKIGGAWQPHSPAVAIPWLMEAEGDPDAPEGMTYFLEASIAEEVIEVYQRHTGTLRPSLEEQVAAVIYYAANDVYITVTKP